MPQKLAVVKCHQEHCRSTGADPAPQQKLEITSDLYDLHSPSASPAVPTPTPCHSPITGPGAAALTSCPGKTNHLSNENTCFTTQDFKDDIGMLSHFSRVWLLGTSWTVACQAPLFMEFSRQEYWSRLPCPPPGNLPPSRYRTHISCSSCITGRFFIVWATGETQGWNTWSPSHRQKEGKLPSSLLGSLTGLIMKLTEDRLTEQKINLILSISACSVAQPCLTLIWPPWTVVLQALLSTEFSRQEYWGGLPFLTPGDLMKIGDSKKWPKQAALILFRQRNCTFLKNWPDEKGLGWVSELERK